MKKSFRNRLLAVTAAASMSFLLLSGFDSEMTVEEVNDRVSESMASMNGLNAEAYGIADLSIDVTADGQTQSIPISGSVDYSVAMTLDPFVVGVSASLSGDASAMGMAGSIDVETYIVGQEDGSGIVYARVPMDGDNGWHAAAMSAEDMEQMFASVMAAFSQDPEEAISEMGIDIASLKDRIISNATLAPDPVNVNNVECYEITQTIDGNTLFEILSEVLDAYPLAGIDSDSLSAFQMLFSGIQIDGVTDCSVDDFTPVYAAIDLSGSDFSTIGQMIGAMMFSSDDASAMPEISVNVNALNLTMSYGEVPDQIEIPADALAAEVETTVDMSEIANTVQTAE